MFSQYKRQAIFGAAFVFSCGLGTSVAHADLTDAVLDEIRNGIVDKLTGARILVDGQPVLRKIRDEITSLKTVPVPEPTDLYKFVKNKQRAIELGKALFWDMQVGSDGIQACASCHFNAGADSRAKNQVSPGLLAANQDASNNEDLTFQIRGPNGTLSASDFPFHVKSDKRVFTSTVVRDSNDVASSQGVAFSQFVDAKTGEAVDETSPESDPKGFQVGGVNTRRVEPRQTPTVINAVFNHRNFWDGRANNIFNGVNEFGDSAPDELVSVFKKKSNGKLKKVRVSIDNSSLASQAVGPPVSSFEMSANGRNWMEIGDKFLVHEEEEEEHEKPLRPLGKQKVHRKDSVLGDLARKHKKGLTKKSYAPMIKAAFKKKWWGSEDFVLRHADGTTEIVDDDYAEDYPDNTYSHMEANFSLFFGLAVQMYEATLISDDSPVDRFLDGDETALTDQELVGFHLADSEARCLNCHGRGEFTFAAVSRINEPNHPERGLTRDRRDDLMDEGFNNIGVRPTLEDLGVGGIDPFGKPLSFGRQMQLELIPEEFPGANGLDLAADGAFKIPTLRNVALTAPYFHNGGEDTLEDVVDFYFRGGNFRTFDPLAGRPHSIVGFDKDRVEESLITGLGILQTAGESVGVFQDSNAGLNKTLFAPNGLDEADRDSIVAFMKALTDPRVPARMAPFDGPQLFVPGGHPDDETFVIEGANGNAVDDLIEIPAVGKNGGDPVRSFADNLQ